MASVGKVVATLEVQSAAFSKGTQQAGSDLEKFQQKCDAARGSVGKLRAALDKMKSEGGRGSTLDELAKTLRGAGALAGVALIGEGLKNATGQAAEMGAEFRKGQIDATAMGVKVAESIPILGGFVTAGQNIREMLYHEKEQIDDINKTSQITNEIAEARVKLIHDARNAIRDWGKEAASANAKVVESMLPPGKRKIYEIDFSFAEKQDDLKHKTEEQLKGVDDAVKAQREKMAADLLGMQNELGHDKEGSDEYKKLKSNIDQIKGTMQGLTDTAKEQKTAIQNAANAASFNITREQAVAERQGVMDYLEGLQKKLDDLNPDPIAKVKKEITDLGGRADDAAKAIELMNQTEAAEKYKKNAEGLKAWEKELDKTQAKIDAVNSGADEATAEKWSQLGTNDYDQREQFAALAQRQQAEDKALKTIEDQKRVVQQITDLQKEAAQVGMTEAQKHLDDLKRDNATTGQVAQAKALQEQIDKQTKAAEQFKTDQEDAKKLIEQSLTPLDKFKSEADRINDLFMEGLLTAKQASDALDIQGKELAKANKDENRHAGAETRRFDFVLPREPKHQDTAKELVKKAEQQLAMTKDIKFFLNQLYNFGQTDQQNADVVYNF